MSEEKQIMDYFGFGQTEGDVRGEHFSKILTFLKINSGKSWDYVKEVSPLFVHMHFRYIHEGYVKGLIRLEVIKFYTKENNIHYKWIGIKSLNGESIKQEKQTEETEKGKCPTCNKDLPEGKIFCNEECLRKHHEKKKEK